MEVALLSEVLLHRQLNGTALRLTDRLAEQGAVSHDAAVQTGFIQQPPEDASAFITVSLQYQVP